MKKQSSNLRKNEHLGKFKLINPKIGDDSKRLKYQFLSQYYMSEAGEKNIDEYEDDFEEDLDIDENGVEELDDI